MTDSSTLAAAADEPPVKHRLDYRVPPFLVDSVDLEFELDPASTRVRARLAFRRNWSAKESPPESPLVLDCEGQEEVELALDGSRLSPDAFTVGAGTITLHHPPPSGILEVRSRNAPAANTALEGLYLTSGVFCTQCEAEGFRRITAFPDRPDVLARYRVTIIADRLRYPVLLSNGNRVSAGELAGGRHFAVWEDPFPKPSYLFALVAGDLAALEDRFVTASGREIILRIYSTPANLARCHHAMASLKRAMRWDEQRYGREYDLATFMIFCADDFNMGAMENKGLNVFNSRRLLADPASATDDDFDAIRGVVGHEYFHNWTGNRVTCRDWFQLSLKEGLTVYREQEFSGETGSRAVERIDAVAFLRHEQFAEDSGPTSHPVRPDSYREINNFYTPTIYEKGAELIRMQRTLLGPERFRRGMDLYFERHDGQAVTCDDFVQAMQDASGVDLGQFRRWYAQAGTPRVAVHGAWNHASRRYRLELDQSLPRREGEDESPPLHIPCALGLVGAQGRDLPLRLAGEPKGEETTRVFELRERHTVLEFADVDEPPVPSLFRGLSAPVRVDFNYRDDELARLASRDSDPVNRWDASQRLFTNAILAIARTRRGRTEGTGSSDAGAAPAATAPAGAIEDSPGTDLKPLGAMIAALVADEASDPALVALALTPPDPAWIAAQEPQIDVDGVSAGWAHLRRTLAALHRDGLEAAWRRSQSTEAFAPIPAQSGRRRLANAALAWLGALDDERAHALVREQFDAANNLTEAIGALAALRDSRSETAAELLAKAEARWRSEPLVLDKWFALQARSHAPGTLGRVRTLLGHPCYNAKNPNRVRALVGAFVRGNFPGFHAPGGAGYVFAADQVSKLDRSNPQLAAFVAGAFALWRRFEPARRDAMRDALLRLAATPGLSPGTSEIVSRSLGASSGHETPGSAKQASGGLQISGGR